MTMVLLELLSEEIPARLQAGARERLVDALRKEFARHGIGARGFTAYSTPRRLAGLVDWVAKSSESVTEERRGPKTTAPPQAIEGFLRATGKSRDELEVRSLKGGEYFFSVTTSAGQPASEALPDIMTSVIKHFTWPKSMRWGSGPSSWVRPLKSILCLYAVDGKTHRIPVEHAGISASSTTLGHGLLSPDPVTIMAPDRYRDTLRQHRVLVDQNERRQTILDGALACVAKTGLELVPDDELLDEITGLVEWPGVMIGPIDSAYLDLPPAIIRTTMRTHQRYLAAARPGSGKISHFLAVANRDPDRKSMILAGNQRVLSARLADAGFFFTNDRTACRERGLDDFVTRLDRMVYHRHTGTQLQRTARIEAIATSLASTHDVNTDDVALTAHYAKADLVSEIVTEFPELQGHMGGHLALEAGLPKSIADAIAAHYQPTGQEGRVPDSPLARIVGIADRINHLVGMFGAGEKVSGSKDPLALRRAAIGLVRIILDSHLDINLAELVQTTLAVHEDQGICLSAVSDGSPDEFINRILSFLTDRFLAHAVAGGSQLPIVQACLAMTAANLTRTQAAIDALSVFMASDSAADLLHVHRRVQRLAGKVLIDPDLTPTDVSPALLTAPYETGIWDQITDAMVQRETRLAAGQIGAVFQSMADLRPSLDAFFDHVLVNAEEDNLRANRLALLAAVLQIPRGLADISLLASDD